MKNQFCLLFCTLAILITSCKKDNPVSNPSNSNTSPSYLFYGEAPTDTLKWESGLNNDVDLAGIGTGPINEYSSSFTGSTANNNISIKFVLPQDTPTLANYNAFFQPSTINFMPENALNGVFFYYVDPSGGLWSTGQGSQTNSYFTISKVQTTNSYTIITASFSCILYNGGSGPSGSFLFKKWTGYMLHSNI